MISKGQNNYRDYFRNEDHKKDSQQRDFVNCDPHNYF
jgi:hypothetical protein